MATFKALSRGTQLVLVAGPLLFLSLFFTWQHVQVSYGHAGSASIALDGWDAWGLLLGLLTLGTVVLVALRAFSDVEFSENVAWAKVCFGLGLGILAVAVVKNLTDSGSSWASYGFVALAGTVALGTYLDWAAERKGTQPTLARKRRGLRSTA